MIAYIDPGTGSLILQTIIAGVVGVTLFFRTSIARVFGWFKKPSTPAAPENTEKKQTDTSAVTK
jgi:hypothetical protein